MMELVSQIDLNKSAFVPQLVSIGPIHREDPKLQEYEWLKECYLHDLLSRRKYSTQEETLEACLLKVNTLIPGIRESYGGMIEKYSDDDVATMMVIDGCFILEFCSKIEEEMLRLNFVPRNISKMQNLRIAMDLILLENQVPFFVLQTLFDCTMGTLISSGLSEDVGLWLKEINLGGYRQVFKENGVNGEYLESMSVFTTEQILRFIRRCHMKWGDFITLCKELGRIK
ncbi:putative UPF0481 protein, partial [Tanacetum coccineum]